MKWNDLSMADKARLMKVYLKNGVTSLDDMESHYNIFASGGPKKTYKEWLDGMHSKYPWLETDSSRAGYDYERYFNENYEDAVSRLYEPEARHFTDRYKLPSHPTFSNESVYSKGRQTGGTWVGEDLFMPSSYNTERYPWLKPYKPVTEDYIYSFKNGGHLFAKGGNPDWDPDNPYHYHTSEGEKVVISQEDWEKYKDDPAFKKVKAAVEAEQKAYPGPEYEVNPQFVSDLRSIYKPAQNYYNYASSLPEGYSFTPEGLIIDSQGNYFVQSDFKQSPRFTYDTSKPLNFTIEAGRPNQRNLTFYPINMEKRIKPSLPVDEIMNVADKKEEAVLKYKKSYSKKYPSPVIFMQNEDKDYPELALFFDKDEYKKPVFEHFSNVYRGEPTRAQFLDALKTFNPYLNDSVDAKEYNRQVDVLNDVLGHEEWFPGYYWDDLKHVPETTLLKKPVIEVEEPTMKVIKKNGGYLFPNHPTFSDESRPYMGRGAYHKFYTGGPKGGLTAFDRWKAAKEAADTSVSLTLPMTFGYNDQTQDATYTYRDFDTEDIIAKTSGMRQFRERAEEMAKERAEYGSNRKSEQVLSQQLRDMKNAEFGSIDNPDSNDLQYAWRRFKYNNPAAKYAYFAPFLGEAMFGIDIADKLKEGNIGGAAADLAIGEGLGLLIGPTGQRLRQNISVIKAGGRGKTGLNFVLNPWIFNAAGKGSRMSKWTPAQWTAAQDAAIARGDMAEAQRLRDLHFKVSAPDTKIVDEKGMPLKTYHTSHNRFNSFKQSLDNEYDGFGVGTYFSKDIVNRGPIKYETYLNSTNPYIAKYKQDLPTIDGKSVRFDNIDNDYLVRNHSGVFGLEGNEITIYDPKNIKSADAVTYDDKGIRIPLGLRDNFKLNDIRYALLPFIGTLGYSLSKKK